MIFSGVRTIRMMRFWVATVWLATVVLGPAICRADDVLKEAAKLQQEAQEFMAAGNYERAIKAYEEVIRLNPNSAEAFNNLGMAYRAVGTDLEEVAWYFKAAIEINPAYADAYDNLGKAYYNLGRFDLAAENCKKALALNPRMLSSAFSLGWIYLLGKSEPAEAIPYFKSVAEATHIPRAYFGLGMAYFMNNDSAMVLEVITKLRALKEDDLAVQLENMIRGHRYVPAQPGIPLVQSDQAKSTLIPSRQEDSEAETQPKKSEEGSIRGVSRIQLRGKLFNLPQEQQDQPASSPDEKQDGKSARERIRELQRFRQGGSFGY